MLVFNNKNNSIQTKQKTTLVTQLHYSKRDKHLTDWGCVRKKE